MRDVQRLSMQLFGECATYNPRSAATTIRGFDKDVATWRRPEDRKEPSGRSCVVTGINWSADDGTVIEVGVRKQREQFFKHSNVSFI